MAGGGSALHDNGVRIYFFSFLFLGVVGGPNLRVGTIIHAYLPLTLVSSMTGINIYDDVHGHPYVVEVPPAGCIWDEERTTVL